MGFISSILIMHFANRLVVVTLFKLIVQIIPNAITNQYYLAVSGISKNNRRQKPTVYNKYWMVIRN